MGDIATDADVADLDVTIDMSKIVEGALAVVRSIQPQWENVQTKIFTDGLSNKLVGCFEKGHFDREVVLVRIDGEKTDMYIDRDSERKTMIHLHKHRLSTPLYAKFNNGIAYGFVHGCTIDKKKVRDPTIRGLISKQMCKLHMLTDFHNKHEAQLYSKLNKFFELVPEKFVNEDIQKRYVSHVKPKSELLEEARMLKNHTDKLECDVVFSHNDLLFGNIVYNEKEEKVSFIDFEYAMFNYQPFDIANHFCEYADVELDYSLYPDRENQFSWLRQYLEHWNEMTNNKHAVSEIDVERLYVQVNKFSLVANFFWGIWGLVQAANSTIDFDFLEYSIKRFNEYYAKRDRFLALEVP